MLVLKKYVPDSLVGAIKRLSIPTSSSEIRSVGKESSSFKSLIVVKQGDNLAPVSFLFVTQAAKDTILSEEEWAVARIN